MNPSNVFAMQYRSAQKTMTSPNDVCTIVSIFPKPIKERKPTVDPDVYELGAGSYSKPAILHVRAGCTWIDPGADRQLIESIIPSIIIADSFVKDWSNGLLGVKKGAVPGIFFVEGKFSSEEILKNNKPELAIASEKQKRWYQNLVEIADMLWSQTNGNPRSIPSDARLAVQELQLENKPWMQDFNTLKLENCPLCGTLRNPEFAICTACGHVVDQAKYDALNLKKVVGK